MHALRTAVIQHTTGQSTHHDWLIEDPRLTDPHAPDSRLWTARVLAPPSQWASLGRFNLKVIPPHRRAYLDYQGPISQGRGRVQCVAQGLCTASLWSEDRIVLTATLADQIIDLDLRRLAGRDWQASIRAPASSR